MVIIAHRESAVAKCDRILRLDESDVKLNPENY